MRVGSFLHYCAGIADASMMAGVPVWWGSGHSERTGNTTSSPSTPPPAHQRRLAVVDRQQRRLHDRAHTLGFAELDSYLVARCQDDASLTQLAGELHTTIDVIRRLVDQAGIHRASPKVRSARQRRRATDQRLTIRAEQLGFADLAAYLADRVTARRGHSPRSPPSLASTGTPSGTDWTATGSIMRSRDDLVERLTAPRPTTTSAPPERLRRAALHHATGRHLLKQVAKAYPRRQLHVVVDNYATHKHPTVRAWLAKHPRVRLHFTPTSASWLNLVEVFFAIIDRQALRRVTSPAWRSWSPRSAASARRGTSAASRLLGQGR